MENKQIEQQTPEEIHFKTVLLNQVRNAVVVTDLNGRIVFWNKYAETAYQWQAPEIVGKEMCKVIVAEESRQKAVAIFQAVQNADYAEGEWIAQRKDGRTFPVRVVNAANKDNKGNVNGFIILSIDLSEKQRTQHELLATKSLLEKILVSLGEAIALVDLEGRVVVRCNPAFEKILGYPAEEIIGQNTEKIHLNRESYEKFGHVVMQSIEKHGIFCGEYKLKRKEGKAIFTEHTITRLSEDQGWSGIVVSVFRDITQRKRAESEIKRSRKKLRSLTRHLQTVREQERANIAREIHDEVGHALTALKLEVSWLSKKLDKDQTALIEKTQSMSSLIDESIRTLQRVAAELRPSLLDNLGLTDAIEWHVEEFHKRTGIEYDLKLSLDDTGLNRELAITLFRIFQELLTNVSRHANATCVGIYLKQQDASLQLTVRDNGMGISTKQMNNPKSFGLIGIRERVHAWHGKCKIHGTPEGTSVTVIVPIVKTANTVSK